eukprot:g2841.t1
MEHYSLKATQWTIQYDGKQMQAIGSRRLYEFILYLISNPLENTKNRYKAIEQQLAKLFPLPKKPDAIYHYLRTREYAISKYLVKMTDEHFLDAYLSKWKILDRIRIIWSSFESGVSASTSRYGNQCLIKVDLYKFVLWLDDLKVAGGASIGSNGCQSVLGCILYTVCHEVCHCLLQMASPTILDGENIVMRSKDPFLHNKMLKKYNDKSILDSGEVVFVFGQRSGEFGAYNGIETDGGHRGVFMQLLEFRFGQKQPSHSLYKIKF